MRRPILHGALGALSSPPHALALLLLFLFAPAVRAERLNLLPFNRPSEKFSQALELISQGELRLADALLEQVIDKEPGQVYASLARVQVALTERRLDTAERAVRIILKREPSRPEAHNMAGIVAFLQKQPDAARRSFARAVELRPTYVTPMVYLGALERSHGNYEQAVAAYRRLIETAPRLPAGYLGTAEAQIMMRKAPDAFKTLESWRRADPGSTLPPQVIANVYLSMGEPMKAIEELTLSLERHPRDIGTLTTLGTAYAVAGNRNDAARQFNAALAIDRNAVDALLGLGDLEVQAGATDQALVKYRRALDLRPDHPVACNNVAWVLAERGQQLREALMLAKRATAADATYVDAHDTLGWVLFRRGEYAAAIAALQQAKSLAPSRADVAAHLGLAYAQVGRKLDALIELKRALGAGPALPQRADVERAIAKLSSGSK